VPVLRKDWNGVEGKEGDVFYFGIVDVLQPYTLKKQLEHSIKSLVQVLRLRASHAPARASGAWADPAPQGRQNLY
jgi:hypothetical protein